MSSNARTALAVVLVGVAAVGVGLAVLAFPDANPVPQPIAVALDFEPFVPGVEQAITHDVEVPVVSDVMEAGLVHSSGVADRLDVSFELCRGEICSALVPGAVVQPGAYTVVVTAVIDPEVSVSPAGSDAASGSAGVFAGQILLAEVPSSSAAAMSPIWLVAVLAGAALVVVVAASLRGRVST